VNWHGTQPRPWPARQPRPEPGDKITVRTWLQPSLRDGDPDRVQTGSYTGAALWVDEDLVGLRRAPGGFICVSEAWAGGDPSQGTGRWHVPQVVIRRRRR
jgi:hypothetical protein